jgi:radical SAM protein with 4Fe4S-binding SPASM domain
MLVDNFAERGMGEKLSNYIINLEITNRCNLNCFFCRAEANKHLDNELSKVDIFQLFHDLKKMKTRHVSLTGGEPLIREDVLEIIETAKDMGFELSLSTNGTLLKSVPIELLKVFNPIRISLDAPYPEIHDKIRGKKGVFERTVEGIRYLVENCIYPVLRFTISKENADYLEDFLKLSANLGVKKVKVNRIIPIYGCKIDPKYILTPYEYRDLLIFTKEKAMEYGIEVSSEDPIAFQIFKKELLEGKKFGGCGAGIIHIHINSRGEVFPCPYLPIKLGSIREERIYDILIKHKVWKFFMNIRLNVTGKCEQCKNKKICGGCRAAAFSIRGNILDPDPLCFNV